MNYQSNFWEEYFKCYDTLMTLIPYEELLSKLVDSMCITPADKILDLGAGTGNLNYFLPDHINIISLDNSSEALARLHTKFPKHQMVKHSILEPLPFDDNTFDKVVSNNVLYTLHPSQWDHVVSEINRVCKPGAIVVISNVQKHFRPFSIYLDHIRKSLDRFGAKKTLYQMIRLTVPTLKILMYNRKIRKDNKAGVYSFVDAKFQESVFKNHAFKVLEGHTSVYSNQASLSVFQK